MDKVPDGNKALKSAVVKVKITKVVFIFDLLSLLLAVIGMYYISKAPAMSTINLALIIATGVLLLFTLFYGSYAIIKNALTKPYIILDIVLFVIAAFVFLTTLRTMGLLPW